MIILPPNIRITTDKPVNRSTQAYAITQLNVFALRGLSFLIFTKNKEGVRAIRAMEHKKGVAGKYTRARAPLVRKYTNRIFESKDGTTSMKIVNYIETHSFC